MFNIFTTVAAVTLASASFIPRASAANHTVVVGGTAGLKFTPEQLTAEVGDFITYIFQAKNHTVTQSGFAAPCKLLENATISAVGFDSGYVPVAADAKEFPAWTIEVLEKKPIWFYCKQGNHCQQGMVGSINAATTGEKTHEAFKALAMAPPAAAEASAPAAGAGYGGGAYGGDGYAASSSAWSSSAAVISPTTTGINAGARATTMLDSAAAARLASSTPVSSTPSAGTGAATPNAQFDIGLLAVFILVTASVVASV